jgi:hypothetical protein
MSFAKAIKYIGLTAVGCGLAGFALGVLLGILAPGYYRGVFRLGNDPSFNPIQVGAGLGLTQGLVIGIVVGCVITFAVAWYESRTRKSDQA